jgi:ribosomal-protein-alanine N-acetyltransferase
MLDGGNRHLRPEQVEIRAFHGTDLPRILQIESSSFASIDAFSESTFRKWYEKCPDLYLVAEVAGRVVGYMITCVLPDKGDVVSLAVDPSFRRHRVAVALVQHTSDQLDRLGLGKIELEVRPNNDTALHFYARLGFEVVRTIPHFYRDGGEALLLRKLLQG